MHAYILTGSDETGRTDHIHSLLADWHVSAHDVVTLMPIDNAIGIDAVRSITSELSFKPRSSSFSVLVVRGAHALSEEAQQALLKTLEEPAGDSHILLETQEPFSLLPTILSRCHMIRLREAKIPDKSVNELFLRSSVGERMKTIDTIAKTQVDALIFVDQTMRALHEELVHSSEHAKLLRALLTARTQLLGNANPKLVLDVAFM